MKFHTIRENDRIHSKSLKNYYYNDFFVHEKSIRVNRHKSYRFNSSQIIIICYLHVSAIQEDKQKQQQQREKKMCTNALSKYVSLKCSTS